MMNQKLTHQEVVDLMPILQSAPEPTDLTDSRVTFLRDLQRDIPEIFGIPYRRKFGYEPA